MFAFRLHIALCLICFSACVYAQQKIPQGYDTISVAGKSFIFLNDSSIFIEKDTVLVVIDSIANQYRRDTISHNDKRILDTLQKKVAQKNLLHKIIDPLVKWPEENKSEENKTQLSVTPYENFEGKIIDTIIVKSLDVFGTNIHDTTWQDTVWFKRAANALHINTQQGVVTENLLFEIGDEVIPTKLSDSERILRNLSFIKDARIVLEPTKNDKVSVTVITRDVWSIFVSGSLRAFEAASLSLTDKNFFGLGHSLSTKFILDSHHKPAFGFEGAYRVNNIRNTFINGELFFSRTEWVDRIGLTLRKDFLTPDIQYAGGLELNKEKIRKERILADTLLQSFHLGYRYFDIWAGRSFLIDQLEGRSNLTFSVRTNHIHYTQRPTVTLDTNRIYTNTTMVLASMTLSKREYRTSHLINGYGVTEDIPSGYSVTVTFGKDFNEFNHRDFLGISMAKGDFFGRLGYLRGELSIGGFFNGESFEQGLIKTKFNYFSNLYRVKKYYLRQFFHLELAKGISRFNEEIINISDENGIRGIGNTDLVGNQKITFSAETIAYCPYYFLGFRFAAFAFADLGFIGNHHAFLRGKLYQGYGFGIRFANENLTFATFQLRFGFYPVVPLGMSNFQTDFREKARVYIEDFGPQPPSIIRITSPN